MSQPNWTPSARPKVVRVEIETEDGKIISLTGADAERWDRAAAAISESAFIHGVKFPELPWKETRRLGSAQPT